MADPDLIVVVVVVVTVLVPVHARVVHVHVLVVEDKIFFIFCLQILTSKACLYNAGTKSLEVNDLGS